MDEQFSKTKCPLCEGLGELSPSAIIERFSNPELRKRLEDRVAEIAASITPVGAGARNNLLDFDKESHNWNPEVPIWRRSPKE